MSINSFLTFGIELGAMKVALVTFIRRDQILIVTYHLRTLTILLGGNMEYDDKDLAEQLDFVDL